MAFVTLFTVYQTIFSDTRAVAIKALFLFMTFQLPQN
jgi:hypothetical protein